MSRHSVILVAVCLAGCAGRNRAALPKLTFEQLTVPAEALPEGCKLTPSGGFPFGPLDKPNPMTTTDLEGIAHLCFFFLGPDIAGLDLAESQRKWSLEVATNIEAAYLALYYDKFQNENAVWALKFKDPKKAKMHFERLSGEWGSVKPIPYFLKGSILITAWTDNQDDDAFLDAIREQMEKY